MPRLHQPCIVFGSLAAVILSAAAAIAAVGDRNEPGEQSPAELKDIALMQGKWEFIVHTPNGPIRTVKEIAGNKTFLKRYDANDAVVWGHRSEFKVKITDRVKILTFSNVEVTDGPQQGAVNNGSSSYIYRIEEDAFVEVVGMLTDQPEQAPEVRIWRRVK